MNGQILKGHLEMLLLAALERGPLHGYALAERLRRSSDGTFDLSAGTLYPLLRRLESAELIAGRWEEGARRRRVYRLTPAGAADLAARLERWLELVGAVTSVVSARG